MSLVSALAIYFVVWWICLFVVLPFGVRSQEEAQDVTPGTERGAPHQPFLVRKAVATTILASVVFACIYLYFGILGLTLEDLVR
jgi:predicted secreted protein